MKLRAFTQKIALFVFLKYAKLVTANFGQTLCLNVIHSSHAIAPLKVLTNENRGGLKVATFGRSPFKLFSLPRGEFKQNSNIAIGPLPTLQTSPGLLALFEKIYYGDLIFPVISNNGEDVQHRCFN